MDTIFVSMAAYRDPELVPSVEDCLAKARRPERLRFGICWQHGSDEMLAPWMTGRQFRVLDVDWRDSLGACWARSETMRLYDGEVWYLQLDSHHRFAEDWDVKLLAQARACDSTKPLLTTYASWFVPGEERMEERVTRIDFLRFTPDGSLLTLPGVLDPSDKPMRARFASAHFLLAAGGFVEDVPYDPELYFMGEEITLAVRAFSHGYDLFHPSQHILWHRYTREDRRKHWDDHTPEQGFEVPWYERNAASLDKVARFLAEPFVGRHGLGSLRTLEEYEAYAGISFRHRRVQDYTRHNLEPPNPPADPNWPERVQDHRVEISLKRDQLPPAAIDDPSFWYVSVQDRDGAGIIRSDATPDELAEALAQAGDQVTLIREFECEATPRSWTIWPHSASEGWLASITRPILRRPSIFVSIAAYRDPDLVPTITDCLAKSRHPERLRFGVCWQHGPEEDLPVELEGPQFEIVDVDYRESRGASWARARIMDLYDGEDWYLQLDSHHRFVRDWDEMLVEQAAATGSPKPLLSAPAPAFTPGEPLIADVPWCAEFDCFRDDGIPRGRLGRMSPELVGGRPIRAREVCGHFLFAPGSFVEDVRYNPEMYFAFEETTIGVRAFTHGYDLFHPSQLLLWHEYSRAYRTTHWQDHADDRGPQPTGYALQRASIPKVAAFFASPSVGRYGLGTVRTFAEFEAYAGLSFRHRCAQDYTRLNREPPNPPGDPDWPARVRGHRIEISLKVDELAPAAVRDPAFWFVAIDDGSGHQILRRDADAAELRELLNSATDHVTLVRELKCEAMPVSWTVWPYSSKEGWLQRVSGRVAVPA